MSNATDSSTAVASGGDSRKYRLYVQVAAALFIMAAGFGGALGLYDPNTDQQTMVTMTLLNTGGVGFAYYLIADHLLFDGGDA